MPKPKPTKPYRSQFSAKLADPHHTYRGNTDHWSIMRVKADTYVMQQRAKERQRIGVGQDVLGGQLLTTFSAGCPFQWSREKAVLLRGGQTFSDFAVEGLGGEKPGDLSSGLHRNYNRRVIHWTPNHFRAHAKQHFKYWMHHDLTFKKSLRPRQYREKLPL